MHLPCAPGPMVVCSAGWEPALPDKHDTYIMAGLRAQMDHGPVI
jgi:hypothetical protein